jgi:hypothetical protein
MNHHVYKEGVKQMHQLSNTQRKQIAELAYQMWQERGRPLGSPDDDWFRAERELTERSDWTRHLPLSSLMMEPVEY